MYVCMYAELGLSYPCYGYCTICSSGSVSPVVVAGLVMVPAISFFFFSFPQVVLSAQFSFVIGFNVAPLAGGIAGFLKFFLYFHLYCSCG